MLALGAAQADTVLVEAEQFADKGGWQVDTQFIESMGSPYLIAHGLGKPVADASTDSGNQGRRQLPDLGADARLDETPRPPVRVPGLSSCS